MCKDLGLIGVRSLADAVLHDFVLVEPCRGYLQAADG